MATSTFDRRIEVSDAESLKRLIAIMSKEVPKEPLSAHPFSDTERVRGEELLNQFLSRLER